MDISFKFSVSMLLYIYILSISFLIPYDFIINLSIIFFRYSKFSLFLISFNTSSKIKFSKLISALFSIEFKILFLFFFQKQKFVFSHQS